MWFPVRRLRLVHSITLAMLVTLLAVVGVVAASLYAGVSQGFDRYVRGLEEARLQPAVRRLEALYARDGDFGAISEEPRRLRRLVRREPVELPRKGDPEPGPPPGEASQPGPRRSTDPLEIPPRVSLYDGAGQRLAGEGTLETDASRLPLVVDGKTVGWLGLRAVPGMAQVLELPYAEQVRGQVLSITLGALVLGMLGGWLLARRLTRPLEELGRGARQLAVGDYSARVAVQSSDELGELARTFNTLASALEEAERGRKQWVADTSHELRTPLAVLRAELEALQDGVRPLVPAALESLKAETDRMERLVEDLGALARSDQGELALARVPVDVQGVVEGCLGPLRERCAVQRLSVEVVAGAGLPRVLADPHRLAQVFSNLLENSLRYTDAGGRVRVELERDGAGVRTRVDDSAPGVAPEHLPRLFERLFRAEPSRSRAHGGSGLGLSICQRLVAAHGGRVAASPSPLGGLRVEVWLPGADA